MNKTWIAIFLLGTSVLPLRAQDQGEDDLKKAVNGALEDAKKNPLKEKAAERAKLEEALKETLDELGRASAGKGAADYIADEKNGVRVVFQTQESTSSVYVGCQGGTTICLSDALPAYPRALAPQIVTHLSNLAVGDFPWGAEQEYVYISLQTRAWLELGGDKDLLPMIEPLAGYKDEELSARFKLWLGKKPEEALDEIAKTPGRPRLAQRLAELEAELKDPQKPPEYVKGLEEVKKRWEEAKDKTFPEFLRAEEDWRQAFARQTEIFHPRSGEWKGNCGVAQASHRVVATAGEWVKLWKEIGHLPPAVDFGKSFAVAVFLGSRPSGGFRVKFLEPYANKAGLVVPYKVEAVNGPAIAAVTQPYAVKLFPKTADSVLIEKADE